MLVSLFSITDVPPPHPQDRSKRHRVRNEDESRSRKKERNELKAGRRASLIAEESRQLRVLKVAAGASISRIVEAERSTTDGVFIAEDTTDGVPIMDVAGFGKSYSSAC